MVRLKHLSNFWRALKMPLINCEINLQLKWSENCFLVVGTIANQQPTFTITDTNIYITVVLLSTNHNGKFHKQLKYGFKRAINWNKWQCKIRNQAQYHIQIF